MAKFHSLKIKKLERPTDESVALTFDVPADLRDEFSYHQGQHLTLRAVLDGEEVRRSYSVCSCPLDEELSVAIKKIDGGKFSTYANDVLKVGDVLDVMPPLGHFYRPLDAANEKWYVAFASGSGITPILSIIKTTLLTEPKSQFILFFGNRTKKSIMFREKLEDLKNEFMGRFSLHHVLSKERQETALFNGRMDAEKVKTFARIYFNVREVDDYFICGPEEMMIATRDTLQELGAPAERIHVELFTSPVGKLGGEKEIVHEKVTSEITIVQDGVKFSFPYDSDLSILDAAFQHGGDFPYACKGGVCSTCAAHLVEGEVEMDVNYALEPDELERGLILTCQAFPKTEKVVISFDV
jgi:ring-1,2-phenylacetyl-CoA epoxidase subunit PaaE